MYIVHHFGLVWVRILKYSELDTAVDMSRLLLKTQFINILPQLPFLPIMIRCMSVFFHIMDIIIPLRYGIIKKDNGYFSFCDGF